METIKYLCKLESDKHDKAFPINMGVGGHGYDLGGYRFLDTDEAIKYLVLVEKLTEKESEQYLEALIEDALLRLAK